MRIGGTRISRAHNLAQQSKRWIGQFVFFQDRIERNIFAVMPELAVRNVEDDFVFDLRPVSTVRKENKLSCRVNKMLDQPRTCGPVDLDFFAGNPFHGLDTRRSCPSPAAYCSANTVAAGNCWRCVCDHRLALLPE